MKDLLRIENGIGLDEVGRGPLAGPVTAAAVYIPETFSISGIDDSKKLRPVQREELSEKILAECPHSICHVMPDEIDSLNILWASMKAMAMATEALLREHPEFYNCIGYVDGNRIPPRFPLVGKAVIQGDQKMACIAAASIIAKVSRDRFMKEFAMEYPEYGFEIHHGYATSMHLDAIRKNGPCPIHRRSFRPIFETELAF